MKYAIWLDGVILKVDLTDTLYKLYKGERVDVPFTLDTFEDWKQVYNLGDEIYFLSPYTEEKTMEIMKSLDIKFPYIANDGMTKPSKAPYEKLIKVSNWNPAEIITIGASPLDLLSARFYDSRIKVVCVERFIDCSRYSPYLIVKDLSSLVKSLKRLRKI